MARDFNNRQVVVMGAGRSGLALVDYFLRRGASVTLSDRRGEDPTGRLAVLAGRGVRLDLGGHTSALFVAADLVAISPGVPLDLPVLEAARANGVPVLGEVEVAFREMEAPLVAVTGTNGKSTTVTVMGEVFRAWGQRTFVGGNIGTPLVEALAEGEWDWLVAELSSFQLETVDCFRPRYGLLLNLSEDHLDRYPDMESYVAAKARMFARMTADDVAILNAEDPLVLEAAASVRARRVLFSSARILDEGMGFANGEIVWRMDGAERRFESGELRLKGLHNVENVMAALIPPLLEGCPPEVAWEAACACDGLAHRMALVRELDGVAWYDDSKGTNVGSVVKSLAGLSAPVTLIAGGKDKGGDYAPLIAPVREKVRRLILIGEAAGRMEAALGGLTDVVRATTLEDAVTLARESTPAGGAVLLSPGCSSFDMFKSFEERGERFCAAVHALPQKGAA